MRNTKSPGLPKRFILSVLVLTLLSAVSYLATTQKAYAAACVSAGPSSNRLAIQTI